ncbi:MAG TPA: tetratricopeptide repeat protein [Lapillicoccus sp.]|jgi:putative thioredoxin|uniref:co-chaperone YbbN n=1 Tax=Lapillicoccus sp. TaxID=1909287 RepID=UPI002F92834E
MTQQPFPPAALRGAVDLSALKRPAAPARGAGPGAPGDPAGATEAGATTGLLVTGSDATFQDFVNASLRYPVVVVLWSSRLPDSGDFVKVMGGLAASNQGRFQVVSVDVDENPGLLRALQVEQVPMTIALLQGRPLPLFVGPLLPQEVQPVIDELLQVAVQNGVTGRVTPASAADAAAAEEADEDVEPELPPHIAAAYDAIETGDLAAAATAYEQALAENPADAEAKAGLAQVGLMRRTEGVDPVAARAAAAADPTDVPAQILVADLDLLGGHVEDAFARLVDTVRATSGDERNQAREHLLELFEVVGSGDERVTAGRRALMSALF